MQRKSFKTSSSLWPMRDLNSVADQSNTTSRFLSLLKVNWWGNSSNDRTDIKASVSVKISIDLGFIRSHTSFCLWLLRYFLKSPPSISSSISNSSPRGSDVIPKQRTMFLWSNLLCERDTYIPYILLQTVKLSNYFFYLKQDTCTNKGKFGNKLSIFSFDIKGSCFSDKWNEKFNCRKHKLIL